MVLSNNLTLKNKLFITRRSKIMLKSKIKFGCGLIRIGRVWGVDSKEVPSEKEALEFLEFAFLKGVRFFDTAPAYGLSESRLGKFFKQLTQEEKDKTIIATKMGEHWNSDSQETYVDHSYNALTYSIEKSMDLLGKISILQLHKASVSLLKNGEVSRAFEYAQTLGIQLFGTSISDIETGLLSCEDDRFSYIQLPYNKERADLLPVILRAKEKNKKILFNRPLAMGAAVQSANKAQAIYDAFSFIDQTGAEGVLLSGTASTKHLKENIEVFKKI